MPQSVVGQPAPELTVSYSIRAWGRFTQKTDEEITVFNAVAISKAESLAIAAIAPNAEMGSDSVADVDGT